MHKREKEEFVRFVRKTGTSLGINIPSELVDLLSISEDDMVRVTIEKIETKSKKSHNKRILRKRK